MEKTCIHGLESLPDAIRGCVLTIGNFDGVHVGHQRIVAVARDLARQSGTTAVALTFEPSPDQVLRPSDVIKRIAPVEQKVELLFAAGSDVVVVVTADRELLSMTPREFIDRVIVGRLAARHVVEGPNFFFGCRRSGNVETLAGAAERGGYTTHVVEPVMLDLAGARQRVSSTLIRSLVEAGAVDDAARCLGRDFALFGAVVRGTGRGGSLLGFPTVNVSCPAQVIPADGIYAGRADVNGTTAKAAISVGCNPTLGGVSERAIEAHLIDCSGDFYGCDVALRFARRLRSQEKFTSVEALRSKIAEDIASVRQIIK